MGVGGWVGGGGGVNAEIICKRQAAAQMSRRGSSTLVALGTLALLCSRLCWRCIHKEFERVFW